MKEAGGSVERAAEHGTSRGGEGATRDEGDDSLPAVVIPLVSPGAGDPAPELETAVGTIKDHLAGGPGAKTRRLQAAGVVEEVDAGD
jgi:hypothetical protein